jgi:RNA polymerase sigma-70 factor (ECF subfamily)
MVIDKTALYFPTLSERNNRRPEGKASMTADRRTDEERLVDLMIGYQKGGMDDFEELFDTLKQPLLRYLWTFVRNASVAEDLLQETFLQIHRARHTYTPRRPVRPWIYAITRHVALMHLRSGRRRKEFLAEDALPEVPVPPEMEKLADRATIHTMLSELPRQSQEVLMLHHLLGLSFDEVGRVLGIAPGTAKVRSHRALKKIRSQLDEQGGSP